MKSDFVLSSLTYGRKLSDRVAGVGFVWSVTGSSPEPARDCMSSLSCSVYRSSAQAITTDPKEAGRIRYKE